jgi:hypothetical protein
MGGGAGPGVEGVYKGAGTGGRTDGEHNEAAALHLVN